MKTIKFNGSIFQVTEIVNGEITKIKRLSEPYIEVDVYQYGNTLKLIGWNDCKPFEVIN